MAAGKASSRWMRRGNAGSNPIAPGSYGGYFKERKAPKGYTTTAQQHRIGNAGREVGKQCRGKAGSAFYECRSQVLSSVRRG